MVFGPDASQDDVYNTLQGNSIIDKVIHGFNATVMVYGQTGSGKSYTMEGYDYVLAERNASKYGLQQAGWDMKALTGGASEESQGVAVRSINKLFSKVNNFDIKVRDKYRLYASMFQIYNESVYDLLNFGGDLTDTGTQDAFQAPLGSSNF